MSETSQDFVHLHVHTQYSLLDGAIRIDALMKRCLDFQMSAVAITDHGTMFGVLDFYEKAKAGGIKPIIGCECYLAPRSLKDKSPLDSKGLMHIILLAENETGYKNLCRLCSIAHLEGFYYKPRIDKPLLKSCSKGLIALSSCLHGEIPGLIKEGRLEEAEKAARDYQQIMGEGNFFLEIQNNGIEEQNEVNRIIKEMSKTLSIPLIATNDCHYLNKEDARAHDVLLCVQTGKTIHESDRLKFKSEELYFKSKSEMTASFKDQPDAVANSLEIAKRCHFEFDTGTYHFPKYMTDSQTSEEELFKENVRNGFERTMARIKGKRPDVDETVYRDRLENEIDVITEMGFCGYFLIVSDFIRYAKSKRIPVGPGRGSAAGSLVAYSLGITDLDPIAHGLIFERFLNPARKSMPDIDVDFCIKGREDVFRYVVDRYGGGEYVAQIITFGKLKTRAVIRDVGRALAIPLSEVDGIAKMVPDVLNITLEDALLMEPRLSEAANNKPVYAELLKVCHVLEGLPRHASTHAAGVVIADKPLVEYMPLYRGKRGEVVTQFEMKSVEKIGLVKFDFLGLKNLTIIADTISLITRQGKTAPDLENLHLDDPLTFQLLCSGDTTGVFQLESAGMKDLLVRLQPGCFEDVIALVALYRPGPLGGMSEDFVQRKHGKKAVEYLVPDLEPILNETYGVIVYQEQVMKIAAVLADYTMSEADDLRKAMGKKIPAIMQKQRNRFMEGSRRKGVPSLQAEKIFDLMEKFGGYGFNKSHSAAYSLIAYQTAYLKAHYPLEFMASLLSNEMESTEGVEKFISECRSHKITILPPDINESEKEFIVEGNGIRFGLIAVKNVGEAAIESILEAQQARRFTSLFDFCERVDLRKVNKRVIESLIKCGAFDSTGEFRSRMTAILEEAIEFGQKEQKKKFDPQMGLFGSGNNDESAGYPPTPQIDEWDEQERLGFEKEALGFYMSGHPLSPYETQLHRLTSARIIDLRERNDGEAIRIGGMVSNLKIVSTKKGGSMAFMMLEDMLGAVEVVLFPTVYSAVSGIVAQDALVLTEGRVQKNENAIKIIGEKVMLLVRAEEELACGIHLHLDMAKIDESFLVRINGILKKYPGKCSVYLHLQDTGKTETVIAFPETFKTAASPMLMQEIRDYAGYEAVKTEMRPVLSGSKPNNHAKRQ